MSRYEILFWRQKQEDLVTDWIWGKGEKEIKDNYQVSGTHQTEVPFIEMRSLKKISSKMWVSKFISVHANFEMSARHPNGDSEKAVDYESGAPRMHTWLST